MKETIQTRDIGEVEIDSNQKVFFPKGLFGFGEFHNYAILDWKESSTFQWLQCIDKAELAFIIMESKILFPEYSPVCEKEDLKLVEVSEPEGLQVYVILTIPSSDATKMTANLQGPIILNKQNNKAAQIISMDEKHPVRIPVYDILTGGNS